MIITPLANSKTIAARIRAAWDGTLYEFRTRIVEYKDKISIPELEVAA